MKTIIRSDLRRHHIEPAGEAEQPPTNPHPSQNANRIEGWTAACICTELLPGRAPRQGLEQALKGVWAAVSFSPDAVDSIRWRIQVDGAAASIVQFSQSAQHRCFTGFSRKLPRISMLDRDLH